MIATRGHQCARDEIVLQLSYPLLQLQRIELRIGGTGPNDSDWASDPEWQAFVDALAEAGQVARKAAIERNVELMYTAGEVIYPPCEECHLQFHPGVAGQ